MWSTPNIERVDYMAFESQTMARVREDDETQNIDSLSTEVVQLLQHAAALAEEKRYQEAIDEFDQIINLALNSAEVYGV